MGNDKLQGALDLLVLKVLARGPEHGYGITLRVKQLSEDALAGASTHASKLSR